MKTMQNFAAQQLSKKQMNGVKGGTISCTIFDEKGNKLSSGPAAGNNADEATSHLNQIYNGMGWSASCIDIKEIINYSQLR